MEAAKHHHLKALSSQEMTMPIPQTIAGLFYYALARYGIGIIGFALLVPVYLDLKETNAKLVAITESNIRVLETLIVKIDEANKAHEETLKLLEPAK